MENQNKFIVREKRFTVPLSVLIASLVYYLSYANYGFIESDWGMIVVATERFLRGEIFYKDFSILYTPGIYIYTAIIFKLLGVSLSSATIGWSIFRAFNCLLIYLIGTEIVPRRVAIILPLILWLVPGGLHKSFFAFFVLLSTLLLIKMMYQKRKKLYFISGIAAGFSSLFRVDLAGFFVIAFLIVESLKVMKSADDETGLLKYRNFVKSAFTFGSGTLLIVLPFLIYLYFNSALFEAYRQISEYSTAMKSIWFFLPSVKELFSFDTLAIYKYTGLILPFVLYLSIFVQVALIYFTRGFNEKDKILMIVVLFGFLTLNQTIMYPGLSRVSLILPSVFIANVYMHWRYYSDNSDGDNKIIKLVRGVTLYGMSLLLLGYTIFSCSISDSYINGSVFMRFYNKTLLDDPKLNVYTEMKYAKVFNEVSDLIRSHTKEDEYIFTFPDNSQMYSFVTGRRGLAKYGIIVEYMKSEEKQRKVMNLLQEKKVRVIISDRSDKRRQLWASELDGYIMRHYEPKYKVGDIAIFIRKSPFLKSMI